MSVCVKVVNLLVGCILDRSVCFMVGYGGSREFRGVMFIVKGVRGNRGFSVLNGGG